LNSSQPNTKVSPKQTDKNNTCTEQETTFWQAPVAASRMMMDRRILATVIALCALLVVGRSTMISSPNAVRLSQYVDTPLDQRSQVAADKGFANVNDKAGSRDADDDSQSAKMADIITDLSVKLAELEIENKRLAAVASPVRPLECWDPSLSMDRHYIEYHRTKELPEKNVPFFTQRNSRACLSARTNYGNEKDFIPILRKLARGQCTVIVTLGGSISFGARVVKGIEDYSAKISESLNTHMQCKLASGAAGEQVNVSEFVNQSGRAGR
jgi:hypothetical protein